MEGVNTIPSASLSFLFPFSLLSLGVWRRSAVSSPSEVQGRALAENEFSSF